MKPLLSIGVLLFAACTSDAVEPGGVPGDAGADAAVAPDAATGAAALPDGGTGPSTIGPPTGKPPQDPGRDLNGRWLVAQRGLAVPLGQGQVAHNWLDYERPYGGAGLVVRVGMALGF